jgi:hypothetical protein
MVFDTFTKFILLPIYFIIHHNYLFGFLHKFLIKKFYYKKLNFELDIKNIPLQNYSSFLFKTYEYNDRKLIERHITEKNKSIILGGGIGFIPALTFNKSKNKILVFEVNKNIIANLKKNLINNKVKYKIYNNNLVYKKTKDKFFYFTNDFLSTSSRTKTNKKILIKNLEDKKIKKFNLFNTLILDIEGDEEYYILNIEKFKNIKYLFFELHHNIISKEKIIQIMKILQLNNFMLQDKCFNSYYFKRK